MITLPHSSALKSLQLQLTRDGLMALNTCYCTSNHHSCHVLSSNSLNWHGQKKEIERKTKIPFQVLPKKPAFAFENRKQKKKLTEKKNCWWKLTEKLCWYPGQHSWHRVGGHRDQSIWNQFPLWTGTGHSAHLPVPRDREEYMGKASGREISSWKTCRDKITG